MSIQPAAEPAQTLPESSVKDSYRDKVVKSRELQLPVSKMSEPASASSSSDPDFQLPGWERRRDKNKRKSEQRRQQKQQQQQETPEASYQSTRRWR